MEKREALFQKIDFWAMVVFALANLGFGIYFITQGKPYEYLLAFGGLLFLPLPFWVYRLLKMQPVYQLNFVIYLFVFFAYTLGLIAHFYTYVPYYDKVMHTLSGTFTTFLALGLFYLLKPVKKIEKEDFALASVFSLAVSIAVAGLWEISEYALSICFGMDPQNVRSTGVGDTMQDMIVCTVGSLILLFPFYFYYKRGKKDFFMGAFHTFFKAFHNGKSRR